MTRWISILLAVLGIVAIGFVVAASIYVGFRETSRDIAIVILAVFQLISAILMAILLVVLIYTIKSIRDLSEKTIVPKVTLLSDKVDQVLLQATDIAETAKQTTTTVSHTTNYVAERVVSPFIRASSLFAGVKAAASYLAKRDTTKDVSQL